MRQVKVWAAGCAVHSCLQPVCQSTLTLSCRRRSGSHSRPSHTTVVHHGNALYPIIGVGPGGPRKVPHHDSNRRFFQFCSKALLPPVHELDAAPPSRDQRCAPQHEKNRNMSRRTKA
eukprot:366134-Chlamydomonas_euryale.AAC.11